MFKLLNYSKKNKKTLNLKQNPNCAITIHQTIQYFIFEYNFLQKFLKRPSKHKKTRNKNIKNNILEKERFFMLTKNLLKIKKTLKKKIKLLEIFNQMWYLFWPEEYKYIKKQNKGNYKNITHWSVNWDMLAKYRIITFLTNSKKKKKEKKDKKFNVGFFYFFLFKLKKKKRKKKFRLK